MNLRCLLSVGILSLVGLSAARAAEPMLPEQLFGDLDRTLSGALSQSPRMLARNLDLEVAEQDRINARAGLLPNLGGGFRHQEGREERDQNQGFVDATKVYYDVTLTQPLFYWGERRNNDRIGAIRLDMARSNHEEAYRGLAQELRSRFLTLIVLKLNLERTRFYERFAESQLTLAKERHAKKIIADAALATSQLTHDQSVLSRDRAEFDFDNARADFSRLAGIDVIRDEEIPAEIPELQSNLGAIQSLLAGFVAEKEIPTVEAENLRRQIRIEELGFANQKTRLRPKAYLVAGMTQDEQNFTFDITQKYMVKYQYVGVGVSWTLFDGFAAQAGKRAALARKRKAQLDYNEAVDRLVRQARTQVRQLEFSQRNLAFVDRALASARGLVPTRRDEVARGLASESDLALAELAYYDARIQAFYARMDILMRTGDFLGTLNRDPVLARFANLKD